MLKISLFLTFLNKETLRAPQWAWTLWKKDLLPLPGIEPRFLVQVDRTLVNIPTTLSGIPAPIYDSNF